MAAKTATLTTSVNPYSLRVHKICIGRGGARGEYLTQEPHLHTISPVQINILLIIEYSPSGINSAGIFFKLRMRCEMV
jgi:hypothetical protein